MKLLRSLINSESAPVLLPGGVNFNKWVDSCLYAESTRVIFYTLPLEIGALQRKLHILQELFAVFKALANTETLAPAILVNRVSKKPAKCTAKDSLAV